MSCYVEFHLVPDKETKHSGLKVLIRPGETASVAEIVVNDVVVTQIVLKTGHSYIVRESLNYVLKKL